jgi:hypothetical protein
MESCGLIIKAGPGRGNGAISRNVMAARGVMEAVNVGLYKGPDPCLHTPVRP